MNKMAIGVVIALFLIFHGVLSQHDNHLGAVDDTNVKIRISKVKCDEYYRKMVALLRLPIYPTSTSSVGFIIRPVTKAVTENYKPLTFTPVSTSKLPTHLSAPPHTPWPPPAIIGGQTTKVGEFPHMAAIGWSNPEGGFTFNCGGALISPRYVLTACHCTYAFGANDPYPSVVRLGDQNINSSIRDGAQPVEISIRNIHKHPLYTHKKQYNDIALLELDTEVIFTYRIQPACLWIIKDLENYTKAIATGWGIINQETQKKADELQKVTLSILSNEYCNKSLSSIINRKWEKGFDDTQLCAGEPEQGKDTCQGDSGSPLQVLTEEYPPKYYVIGITSFGPRVCARLPAVYTRVSSYLEWIESVVWKEESI